jgi:hypothetical protein
MVKVYKQAGVLYVGWRDGRVEELVHVNGEWAGPIKPPG